MQSLFFVDVLVIVLAKPQIPRKSMTRGFPLSMFYMYEWFVTSSLLFFYTVGRGVHDLPVFTDTIPNLGQFVYPCHNIKSSTEVDNSSFI